MRNTRLLIVTSLLLLALTSCGSPATPTAGPVVTATEATSALPAGNLPLTEDDVPRVALEDAKAAIESGAALVVDVRSKEAYQAGHIPGAINIPVSEIEADPAGLSLQKQQWIITYCTWQNEHTSARAAFLLLQNGYSRVTPILGGFGAWVEAGYPVEP